MPTLKDRGKEAVVFYEEVIKLEIVSSRDVGRKGKQ